MADGEDIQPLVCDNGTGMVKVIYILQNLCYLCCYGYKSENFFNSQCWCLFIRVIHICFQFLRLDLLVMMHQELYSQALLVVLVTLV